MNRKDAKKIAKQKKEIANRLEKKNWVDQSEPMIKGENIAYDMDGRHQGIACGGIGMIHMLTLKVGLIGEINADLNLLKRHLPYHESDHILNMAYNILAGGTCIEDIELRRKDAAWLDALGAKIIPDPTTAGDFLRRFKEADIIKLMEAKNAIRRRIWQTMPDSFLKEAIINVDGTLCETLGECKEGMNISYKKTWGYHPLIVSLGNTREPIYIVNRPGNVPSHLGSAEWIDKSLDLTGGIFKKIWLRGDTDFSLTRHFDKWDEKCFFVLGMDARSNLVKIAKNIGEAAWRELVREPKYIVKTENRSQPENVKDKIVKEREYTKLVTDSEQVAEFDYRPGQCEKTYRMVVLRKNIRVEKGQLHLFDETRYFFYITNDSKKSSSEVVFFANDRCDHENDIDQMKHGVKALKMPSNTLLSNWAYMVIASLAWDLKAWYGLLNPNQKLRPHIIRMEFKRFLNSFMMIPCLIVKTGRKIRYRFIGYNEYLKNVLNFFDKIKKFAFT